MLRMISFGIIFRSFCVTASIVEASVTNLGTSALVATQTSASESQNASTLNVICAIIECLQRSSSLEHPSPGKGTAIAVPLTAVASQREFIFMT